MSASRDVPHVGPLDGIRVLDCSENVAGAYATRLLVGLGADVVRIERPTGDRIRSLGPFPKGEPDPELGVAHLYYNAGKRSVIMDLSTPSGRAELLQILQRFDIFVHSWSERVARQLRLADADLTGANSNLRTVAITHWGRTGPYADRPANELAVEALCGFASMHGEPPREPFAMPAHQYECFAGTYAALGVIASILGGPQRVEVSVLEAALSAVETRLVSWEYTHRAPKRQLHTFDAFYPLNIWPAKDGAVVLALYHPRDWEGLALILGDEALQTGDEFRSNIRRVRNREAVDNRLGPLLRERSMREVFEPAVELRSAVGMVMDAESLLADPHLAHRKAVVELDHHAAGQYRMPAAPFIMSECRWSARRAPLLGEHSGEVPGQEDARVRIDLPPVSASHPLEGVRVLDLTTAWAGPSATRALGALGADVIKIESTMTFDGWRGPVEPPPPGIGNYADNDPGERPYERTPLFGTANRSKRGISLDISCNEGRDLFMRLVQKSDVVLSNFSARVLPNLRIAFEDLCRAREDIILLSMPAYGNTGPYANGVAYGNTMEAMAGMAARFGYADGPPQLTHDLTWGDPIAGAHAAVAVVSSLWHRRRTGRGMYIDLSQQETMLAYLGDALVARSAFGMTLERQGSASSTFAPHGYFPSAGEDEWVAIAAENEDQWHAVANALNPAWAEDSRFTTNRSRLAHATDLNATIAEITQKWDKRAIARRIAEAGGIAAPVMRIPELYGESQIVAREAIEQVDHPVAGTRMMPRIPIRFDDLPLSTLRHAPTYGQDNRAIFTDLLGLTGRELADLDARAVISAQPHRGRKPEPFDDAPATKMAAT
jgi:crotonobetainyl-CoA:carnitine CoA-transferase CaiB-like acyl-CoA transferase